MSETSATPERLQTMLAELAALEDAPLEQHLEKFERAHHALRATLDNAAPEGNEPSTQA